MAAAEWAVTAGRLSTKVERDTHALMQRRER